MEIMLNFVLFPGKLCLIKIVFVIGMNGLAPILLPREWLLLSREEAAEKVALYLKRKDD